MYQGWPSKVYVWETLCNDRMDLEDGSIWPHHNPWKWSDALWPNSGVHLSPDSSANGKVVIDMILSYSVMGRHVGGKEWQETVIRREGTTCSKGPEAGIWPLDAAARTWPQYSGVRALPTELPGRHPSWVFLLWRNKRICANSFSVWEKKNSRQQFQNRLKIPRCLLWCGNCQTKFWRSSRTLAVLYVMDICHVRSVALLPLHHS